MRVQHIACAQEIRMNDSSPVLKTVAKLAVPLTVMVSIVVFFQGHNMPGGGFIAGVQIAAAGAMYLLAFGADRAKHIAWWKFSIVGLLIALLTGLAPMLFGNSFMDHTVLTVPIIHHLPTATFFDVGVYLVVFGTLMTIFVELAQEGV
jgi:multisubunit Na+/H+ antiporter MnhB subunit